MSLKLACYAYRVFGSDPALICDKRLSINLTGGCVHNKSWGEGPILFAFARGRWAGWSGIGRIVILKTIVLSAVLLEAFTSKPIKQGVCLSTYMYKNQVFFFSYISWIHLYFETSLSHRFLFFSFCFDADLPSIWFMQSFDSGWLSCSFSSCGANRPLDTCILYVCIIT